MKQAFIDPLIDAAILLGLLFVTAFDYFIHDDDERPYLRDAERARLIASHRIIPLPQRRRVG